MKRNIPYTLVDTAGQTTAIIDVPIPRSQQPIVAKPLMAKIKNIGQVCFIENENGAPRLQMMGNELSVNGILAGGFYLLKKLKKSSLDITTSGLKDGLKITPNTVYFPKSIIVNCTKNFVDFGGICYQFFPENNRNKINDKTKRFLRKSTENRPAAGIVYFNKNQIRPLIFVKPTNTYVWETCCGSASIAYSFVSGKEKIKQPCGSIVTVCITKNKIRCKSITRVVSKGGEI